MSAWARCNTVVVLLVVVLVVLLLLLLLLLLPLKVRGVGFRVGVH